MEGRQAVIENLLVDVDAVGKKLVVGRTQVDHTTFSMPNLQKANTADDLDTVLRRQ